MSHSRNRGYLGFQIHKLNPFSDYLLHICNNGVNLYLFSLFVTKTKKQLEYIRFFFFFFSHGDHMYLHFSLYIISKFPLKLSKDYKLFV